MTNDYSSVLDADGKPLAPTKVKKAWYLVRKGRAELISKEPMIIQLVKVVDSDKALVFWT